MKTSLTAKLALFLSFLAWSFAISAMAAPLGLDDYLSQVDGGNQAVRSAAEASAGAELRAAEGDLVYAPTVFADLQLWGEDAQTNALFQSLYDRVRSRHYTVGVRQVTPFGLNASVSYTLSNFQYVGLRPGFYEGHPRLELSQSLWRNAFGRETRAQSDAIEAQALATRYGQSFQAKALRAEAEGAYVQLAAARELVRVYGESTGYAQQIYDWSRRRLNLNLGEDSDLFQAQGNLEARNLSLQSARDQERMAARAFNRARGIDSDEVTETLILPDVTQLAVPARAEMRDDVRAAREQARVAHAQAQVGVDRNSPVLEAYASYTLNSRDAQRADAIDNSFNVNRPTAYAGVRFSAPLYFLDASDARNGYAKEKAAADLMASRKLFEQDSDWKDLTQRLNEARNRYAMAVKLVEIQKKKSESERKRLNRGRTTTYQTLMFESDYNLAEASRVQAQSEVLLILAQMKTY